MSRPSGEWQARHTEPVVITTGVWIRTCCVSYFVFYFPDVESVL